MMKRLLSILLLCSSVWATTTVTGNMNNLGGVGVTGGFMRFWLRGCAGNQPRVSGQGIIAPSLGGVYFFDFAANASGVISGTLYSNRDATGLLGGEIECGGSTTATWYGMQAFFGGKGGPEVAILAKNTVSFDISNITPITTNPVVVAPTGDSTYARLDAGNTPFTGPVQVTNAGSFSPSSYICYLCSGLGAFTFSSMPVYGSLFTNQIDGIAGGLTIPNTANLSAFGGSGVSGYCVTNADSRLGGAGNPGNHNNCDGVFSISIANANNSAVWGLQPNISDPGGISGAAMHGIEIDLSSGAGSSPFSFDGIDILEGINATTTVPASAVGIYMQCKANSSTFCATGHQLTIGLSIQDSFAPVGVQLGAIDGTIASSNSQDIQFCRRTSSVDHCDNAVFATAGGNLTLQSNNGQVETATSILQDGVAFASLGTPAAGTQQYCTDCQVTTAATCSTNSPAQCVCKNSGNGAFAKRINYQGAGLNWYCQ